MNLGLAASLCKRFEGYQSRPYICPAGVPTIGYGSTYYRNGRKVTLQDAPMSEPAAYELLVYELQHTYLPGVLRCCPNLVFHEQRCNAIVDFAYNLGVGRLQTSTLRRKVLEEDWPSAREQINRWTRGGGQVLPGLVARRKAESELL